MGTLVTIVLGVVGGLLAAEIYDRLSNTSAWLVRFHSSRLLLIRLFQQATICSVGVWHALRFPRICASSNGNSLPRRHVKTTWRYVAGRTASHVPAADTGGRIGYCDIDGGNALGADTRFR